MFGNVGPLEIIVVLVVVLIIFGPKRLPGLGKQLGTGMREFKESVTGEGKDDDKEELAERASLTAAPAAPDLPLAEKTPEPQPAAAQAPSTSETAHAAGLDDGKD